MSDVIQSLYQTIRNRKENSPVGSYTATLFEKGENEILKKMGEEAVEVIIAAKGEGDDRVVYELADFLYHTLVLLAERDINWADVEAELAARVK